jgi:hypothetical protein
MICGLSCSSLHHVEAEAEGSDVIAVAAQVVEAPVMRIARRVDADMGDAELGPDPVVAVVARLELRSDMHQRCSE